VLNDVIKTFEKIYKAKGDSFITDSYVPVDGEYIIVDTSGEEFKILDKIVIKQDKKTKQLDTTNQYFDFIRKADYMSRYLGSNKAIKNKNIYSNNYFTFFVKKKNVHNGKITNNIIEEYYNILKNPLLKYKNPKSKKLYQEVEKINGKADEKRIEKIQEWIKNNIYDLVPKDIKDESYLKIFFKYDLEEYRKESEKYILTNIYNKNDYNITIDKHIYGLPNDNMGLNSKKPYLENKSRKTKVPYLLSQNEALIQKKFFDYLMNQASIDKTNVYINEDNITAISDDEKLDEILDEDFSGYYLRIRKGKEEVEILDFDIIGLYEAKIKPLRLENVLQLEKSSVNYGNIYTLEGLKKVINEVFFSKFLTSNYFTEPKDLNIKDINLKRNLLLARTTLFRWFYKGNRNSVWKILNVTSLHLIKGSIKKGSINNGYLQKAGEQFNLRVSLKSYFEGGKSMADILMSVRNSLRSKINEKDTSSIDNDNEYWFAVGQLASYFISLSKGKNKVHSLANPIINAKTNNRIKEELRKLYKKYNYIIDVRNKKFNNLFAMVFAYKPEGKVEEDLIIAGYLYSNLIYEKSVREDEKDE